MWMEQETAGAATSLPPLRAPKTEILGDWHDVKDYLIDNISNDTDPQLVSAKTYYLVLEEEELQKWQTTGKNDIKLSDWKSTLTRVYQHLHLFEQPLQALNYVVSLVAGAMSTTTVPVNEPLHIFAVNLYPEVVLQRNLTHYYRRAGSNYLELENHSHALRNVNGFTTPTVIITGCAYNYAVQMLTPHFFEHHLVDTTVINGPDYVEVTSLQYMHTRNPEKATRFTQKVKPNVVYLLQEEATTGEAIGDTIASSSMKKGVRTTPISSAYDMEIVVKHVKRV